MLNDYIEEMACSLEDLFPSLRDHHDVTLALCFDNLLSSVGYGEYDIDPTVFDIAISKYNIFGLNLGNLENIAKQAKYNNTESNLGTQSSCKY